jgi:hypothetical protein
MTHKIRVKVDAGDRPRWVYAEGIGAFADTRTGARNIKPDEGPDRVRGVGSLCARASRPAKIFAAIAAFLSTCCACDCPESTGMKIMPSAMPKAAMHGVTRVVIAFLPLYERISLGGFAEASL